MNTRGISTKALAGKKAVVRSQIESEAISRVLLNRRDCRHANTSTDSMLVAVHESMSDLHKIGLLDKETMREFDELCLPKVKALDADTIRSLRMQVGVSQAVFAAYLNTTKSAVSQWEPWFKASERDCSEATQSCSRQRIKSPYLTGGERDTG